MLNTFNPFQIRAKQYYNLHIPFDKTSKQHSVILKYWKTYLIGTYLTTYHLPIYKERNL